MGLPAVKRETRAVANRRPRLSLVPAFKSARKTGRAPSRAAANAACCSAFRAFAVFAFVVAALGVGRVYLSVQAAEASRDAVKLQSDIKAERYEGDMLEVRQSALGSPSRIQSIAGKAMGMASADDVCYLDVTKKPKKTAGKHASAKKSAAATRAPRREQGIVATLMGLTAGEAQVLLVGDVGLASAR